MRAIDRDRHDTWYLRPKTCARLWSGRVGRDKGGEGWIERRMKRERERFIEECGVESSRRKRGLERKVEGVEISRTKEKRLLHWSRSLPLLDLPQNTPASFWVIHPGEGVNVCNLATVAPCNWDSARAMMLAARMDDFVQRLAAISTPSWISTVGQSWVVVGPPCPSSMISRGWSGKPRSPKFRPKLYPALNRCWNFLLIYPVGFKGLWCRIVIRVIRYAREN